MESEPLYGQMACGTTWRYRLLPLIVLADVHSAQCMEVVPEHTFLALLPEEKRPVLQQYDSLFSLCAAVV